MMAALRHVSDEGRHDRPAIIFIHALGSARESWDSIAQAFIGRYRVLTYDLPGHGRRAAGTTDLVLLDEATLETYCDDLLAITDGVNVAAAHIVGVSLGGMIALRFAAYASARTLSCTAISAAVRLGTSRMWNDRIETVRKDGLQPLVEPTMERWFSSISRRNSPALLETARRTFLRTSPAGYIAGCKALASGDLSTILSDIPAPCFLLGGSDDATATPEAIDRARALIPISRSYITPVAAHMVPLEQPELTAGIIRLSMSAAA
jgi:3-oxoadipate enol-lactonase